MMGETFSVGFVFWAAVVEGVSEAGLDVVVPLDSFAFVWALVVPVAIVV